MKPFFGQPFPILSYHRVRPDPIYGIDLSCREFERQMAWLSAQGYRTLHLRDLYNCWVHSKPFPKKAVVITIDDGHTDVSRYAQPILAKYGFQATLFINTGLLGRHYWVIWKKPHTAIWHESKPDNFIDSEGIICHEYEFMTWEDVLELQRQGMEIGSHGVEHPFLTQVSDEDLQRQLGDSKRELALRLGHEPEFFCYPSGDYDDRVKNAVRNAGYAGAVQTPGHFDLKMNWDDTYLWTRMGIWKDVPMWKFKGLISGWYLHAYSIIPPPIWKAFRWLKNVPRATQTLPA